MPLYLCEVDEAVFSDDDEEEDPERAPAGMVIVRANRGVPSCVCQRPDRRVCLG